MSGPRAVLIGPPGSGKTTIARRLARRWRVKFRDTDADVVARAGKEISDIFLDDGEPEFRRLEAEAVFDALASHDGVLSLGGGAILNKEVQATLTQYRDQGGCVAFLDVTIASAAPRVGFNSARPLLLGNPRRQWQQLMDERRGIYERLASVTVLTDDLKPAAVVQLLADEIASSRSGS